MHYIVLVDFGSTFTKAAVVCIEDEKVIFTTKHPSSVKVDAAIAMEQCFDDIKHVIGEKSFSEAKFHASSSAAGGLRMIVVGLTENLSISAGKNVAFGAGAKIIKVCSGKLSEQDIQEISNISAEMVLFCGGYEKGNQSVLLHNAEMLAKSKLSCPIIYGGNSAVSQQVRFRLMQGGKECFLIPNIIPAVGELNTKEGETIIRELFMKRIVNMKGLSKVNPVFGQIVPTPAVVLRAGNLFSVGTEEKRGIGPLMIVDIGGATTDVHSYVEQVSGLGARIVGASEPYAKRTVEGDLGMRESSDTLLSDADDKKMAEELTWKYKVEFTANELRNAVKKRVEKTDFIADSTKEKQIEEALAGHAVKAAVRRHAGKWEYVHSSNCNKVQRGKNLIEIRHIIGTGGPLIHSDNPEELLANALSHDKADEQILLPKSAKFSVDKEYILFAAGLLSMYDSKLAFSVMENSFHFNEID